MVMDLTPLCVQCVAAAHTPTHTCVRVILDGALVRVTVAVHPTALIVFVVVDLEHFVGDSWKSSQNISVCVCVCDDRSCGCVSDSGTLKVNENETVKQNENCKYLKHTVVMTTTTLQLLIKMAVKVMMVCVCNTTHESCDDLTTDYGIDDSNDDDGNVPRQ